MDQDLLPDVVTVVHAKFTVLRIAANVPQLIAILADPCGAQAISVPSWSVFAAATPATGSMRWSSPAN